MACNNNTNAPPERRILTLQQGGLVQAHVTDIDENEGDVRLDGDKPQDESCQFYLHKHFDESPGKPHQHVHCFESVQYKGYYLYWDASNNKVNLQKCSGTDDALACNKNVWWVITDCSSESANNLGCTSGYKLIQPFDFPNPPSVAPYCLVFDDKDPRLTPTMPRKNGQFNLAPI